jgi:hypothetical protein
MLVWIGKEREEGNPNRVGGKRKAEKYWLFSLKLEGELELKFLAPLLNIS